LLEAKTHLIKLPLGSPKGAAKGHELQVALKGVFNWQISGVNIAFLKEVLIDASKKQYLQNVTFDSAPYIFL
jgi:hypothetical protein